MWALSQKKSRKHRKNIQNRAGKKGAEPTGKKNATEENKGRKQRNGQELLKNQKITEIKVPGSTWGKVDKWAQCMAILIGQTRIFIFIFSKQCVNTYNFKAIYFSL